VKSESLGFFFIGLHIYQFKASTCWGTIYIIQEEDHEMTNE